MKIGLISDTHVPWVTKKVPDEVLKAFQGVDLILHAGDIYSHSVLDDLENIAPVLAALGDDDYPGPDKRVCEKHVLNVEGSVLWLLHEGPCVPVPLKWFPMWIKNRLSANEPYVKPNIIIAGHEHRPVIDKSDGIIHINPGSATYNNYKSGLGTIGILDIQPSLSNIQLIHLNTPDRPFMESSF